MLSVRPSAIAGTFYPFPKQVLESEVNAMLAAAKPATRHAGLAVNLAGSMASFLIETWEARK